MFFNMISICNIDIVQYFGCNKWGNRENNYKYTKGMIENFKTKLCNR